MQTIQLAAPSHKRMPLSLRIHTEPEASEIRLFEPAHQNAWYAQQLETPERTLALLRIEHDLPDEPPYLKLYIYPNGVLIRNVVIGDKIYHLEEGHA